MSRLRCFARRVGIGLLLSLACAVLLVAGSSGYLVISAAPIAQQAAQVPKAPVALVLGTTHRVVGGGPNLHFEGRMDAAAELFLSGRVRHLLLSGANPEIYYNEPQRMAEALLERGVPAQALTLDFAGRRTLDSVVRARRIFALDDVVIVSQPYHLYRALFLARVHELRATGFAAATPPLRVRWRTEVRELFARVLALADVLLLGARPEILGDPEPIVLPPVSPR